MGGLLSPRPSEIWEERLGQLGWGKRWGQGKAQLKGKKRKGKKGGRGAEVWKSREGNEATCVEESGLTT